MAATTIPDGPLQDAAEQLGRALLRAHALSADELLAPLREAMASIIAAANDKADVDRKLAREKRLSTRVLEANDALSKRLLAAQMASENLVRDLAPAMEQMSVTFQRAITHQAALVKVPRVTHVPTGSADQATAGSVEAIRQAPIEAYGASR